MSHPWVGIFESGALVADRFRLEAPLGKGGMGEVWLAHHETLGIPCAVKFIRDEEAPAGKRARFEREARAAAQLRSPNVVQILDYGVWEETPYIAMELLEGESLGDRLKERKRLSAGQTLAIVKDIARALTRAAELGIVHRDLKPDNIFIVKDGDRELVKVLDFGVAKMTVTTNVTQQTATGALIGTPYYMSPEQAHGEKDIDARSDLWSLAIITFQCLVGGLPFKRSGLGALLQAIMLAPLPVPSEQAKDIPLAFDAWWTKAAKREAQERFQTADEMARALETALRTSEERAGAETRPQGGAAMRESIASAGTIESEETILSGASHASDADVASVSAQTQSGDTLAIAHNTTHAPLSAKARPLSQTEDVTPIAGSGFTRLAMLAGAAAALLAGGLFAAGVFSPKIPAAVPTETSPADERPAAAEPVRDEPSAVEPRQDPSVTASAPSASAAPATEPVAKPPQRKPPLRAPPPPPPTPVPTSTPRGPIGDHEY